MTTISTSTSAFYERSVIDMSGLRAEAETLQASLSSGERLTRSSDDPVAASRLRQLQRADANSTIDTANADRATGDLQLTDGALSSLADYVARVKELATQAANGTLTDAQRAGIGQEVASIRENIIQLANGRNSAGGALFGGQSPGDAYAVDASGNASYIGTANAPSLPLGDGQSVTPVLTGPQLFGFAVGGSSTDLMAELKTLSDALQAGGTAAQTAAKDGIDAMNAATDSLTTAQTVVGSRLAWLDLTATRRADLGELRAGEENTVGGTDIASTVARLQQTMTVLEASQASFTKLASLSLFNLIN
ncbi:flagellar biosynthesis protein FlgL [Novosphingobium flavum]|uniref:Flagellar biosynthesis protein FlgL n=1 Tax=Novosphingobium flavum TaxID=1778672 RepID=A0A7X1FRH0_9SPHN|nr:flagellar biosynthesis protein FlgL [Novosphingobium flavum]MBC2665613.1 flagellar biosynthesis protein FlgL [Novosphingobium flavum]